VVEVDVVVVGEDPEVVVDSEEEEELHVEEDLTGEEVDSVVVEVVDVVDFDFAFLLLLSLSCSLWC
jgi:hypothetical protein